MGVTSGRWSIRPFARTRSEIRRGFAVVVLCGAGVAGLAFVAGVPPAAVPAIATQPEVVVPATRGALVELGRRLFFDPAASSRMGMRSCADCHDPAHGYSDVAATSLDDTAPTGRHSQTLVDDGGDPTAHWDGAFSSIDDLVVGRLQVTFTSRGDGYYRTGPAAQAGTAVIAVSTHGGNPVPVVDDPAEAGAPLPAEVQVLPSPAIVAVGGRLDLAPTFVNRDTAWRSEESAPRRLVETGRYAEAFREAYGSDDVTVRRIGQAVAEYCRSIRSGSSAYDRFAAGDASALDPAAARGLESFRGRAGCVACHSMGGPHALFTDRAFHDTGVAWRSEAEPFDRGREATTGSTDDRRRFKTPTLRDVARRGPYMHDASLVTLEDVVRHYASAAPQDPCLDPLFPRFTATGSEVSDLVAFLRALTSDRRPGLAAAPWRVRATRTRLEFVDGEGDALAKLRVVLVPAGDVLPGFAPGDAAARSLETDASGAIEFAPGLTTHTRVVLPDGLPLLGGDLVVDTARGARLTVAVAGRAALWVETTGGVEPPATLTARHVEAATFPGGRYPTTVLERRTGVDEESGRRVRYEGPRRLDVDPDVEFTFPSRSGLPRTERGRLEPVAAGDESRPAFASR